MWRLHSRLDKRLPLSYFVLDHVLVGSYSFLLHPINTNLYNDTVRQIIDYHSRQNDLSNSSGCTIGCNDPLDHFPGAGPDEVSRVSHEVET